MWVGSQVFGLHVIMILSKLFLPKCKHLGLFKTWANKEWGLMVREPPLRFWFRHALREHKKIRVSVSTDHNIQLGKWHSTMLIQCCQMSWGIFILKYLWVNTLNIIYFRSCCCSQIPTDLKSQRPICITCKGTLCNIILTPTGLEECSMFTNCCRYTIGLSFVFF